MPYIMSIYVGAQKHEQLVVVNAAIARGGLRNALFHACGATLVVQQKLLALFNS